MSRTGSAVRALLWRKVIAVVTLLALKIILVVVVLVTIVAVAAGSRPEALGGLCVSDVNLEPVLATIRQVESGGDYTVQAAGASASGAYQIVNGTWDGYGGYTRARDAPPAAQDAKAAEMVRAVLDSYHGDVSMVPVAWYWPVALTDPGQLDVVPMAGAGNRLTVRQYQSRWLAEYDRHAAGAPAAAGSLCARFAAAGHFDGELPDGLENCAVLGWGGYRNGHIPTTAMRYSPASNLLHPAASLAFDELYSAALVAGFDLRGNGYRPSAEGGHTAGSSCHGVGLAVDIDVLVPTAGARYATVEAALASTEFAWLCANAERFGFVAPAWALPKGTVCGGTVGNGKGGWVGDRCCFLEPWHVEAAGVVATNRDFGGTRR